MSTDIEIDNANSRRRTPPSVLHAIWIPATVVCAAISRVPFAAANVVLIVVSIRAAIDDRARAKIGNPIIVFGLAGATIAAAGTSMLRATESQLQVTLSLVTLSESIVGALACFSLMISTRCLGAVGGGDIKLATVMGAALGWRLGLAAVLWSHLVRLPTCLVALCRRQGTARTLKNAVTTALRPVHRWLPPSAQQWASASRMRQPAIRMDESFLIGVVIVLTGWSLL